MNNHYATIEYKEMKTVGIADYRHITLFKHPKGGVEVIMTKFSTPKNIVKYYQMGTIGGVHFQFVNNQYAKFENI